MSKKSKWKIVAATDSFKLLTPEEKVNYWKEKKAREKKLFKWGIQVDKMPTNKPHFKRMPKKVDPLNDDEDE